VLRCNLKLCAGAQRHLAAALLEARVPLRTQITFAGRIRQWPETVIAALTIATLAAIAARAKEMGIDRHPARPS